MSSALPFDGVLLMAFGGPREPAEVRPFLQCFSRDKGIPPQRIEDIARRYALIGGKSPLPLAMQEQATALSEKLAPSGIPLSVHVAMLNWHPFIADVLNDLSQTGRRRIIALNTTAHHSPASCGRYREAIRQARQPLIAAHRDIDVVYADSWFGHPLFIQAVVHSVQEALNRLPVESRRLARLVFTAHSLPLSMARQCRYREQLQISAELAAEALSSANWTLVYQSRSGNAANAWLGPDIRDYLRDERNRGLSAVVIVPIGFTCDHLEVAYDLDREVADLCQQIGLPMVRATTVGREPAYIEMLADLVRRLCQRHEKYPPLPIVAGDPR